MHQAIRLTFAFSLAVAPAIPMQAKPAEKQSEYKQDDKDLYLKSDVLKMDPNAVILSERAAPRPGSSFFLPARKHPAKEIYIEHVSDWIEPITPPNMPPNLDIPLDVMQVREPHGDVQVALPSAPANFNAVTDGMVLPNGSVLKTGGSGVVAVLFGGVDSVRLAPNSQAAVELMVSPGLRDAEVDLSAGIAYSKVGLRIGEKEDYQVHTSFGVASAHGTDFATVALPERIDVWVAQGTVQLISPEGEGARTQTTKADGKGPLKVMRYPLAKDAQAALMENSETLTAVLSFIPMANQKLKILADRVKSGDKLTATETDYLSRIRKIPSLSKLTWVAPPAPTPAPVAAAAPLAPAPPVPFVDVTAPKAKPAASSGATDPNSLTPGGTKKASDAGPGGVPTIRQRKVLLDLRDQDTSTSTNAKPAANGPNDTAP